MKLIKLSALLVCATALFISGCASTCCHKSAGACPTSKPACGHACCAAAKTDCAHCPTCSAHK